MTENLSHLHDVIDNAVIDDRENGVIRAKREIFTDDWYRRAFDRPATRGKLVGDITPEYSTIPEAGIQHVRGLLGAVEVGRVRGGAHPLDQHDRHHGGAGDGADAGGRPAQHLGTALRDRRHRGEQAVEPVVALDPLPQRVGQRRDVAQAPGDLRAAVLRQQRDGGVLARAHVDRPGQLLAADDPKVQGRVAGHSDNLRISWCR